MADPEPSRFMHEAHEHEDGGAAYKTLFLHELYEGYVQIDICTKCHYVKAACLHSYNHWINDEEMLVCDLCGLDGT